MATPPPGGPGWPVTFQIACSPLSNLAKQSSFLDTCSKKDKRAMGFKAIFKAAFLHFDHCREGFTEE